MDVTTSDVPITDVNHPGDASPTILTAIATNDAVPANAMAATAASVSRVRTRSVNTAMAPNPCSTSDTSRILDRPKYLRPRSVATGKTTSLDRSTVAGKLIHNSGI